jgi:hypothetical protein
MRPYVPTRPVEGAQDLYPRDVRLRAWLSQTIAGVLDWYGFESWDAPLLEPLSLYEAGKNLPLVENQALVFRGPMQEPLHPRAEPTPSLSRVVAGLNNHLVLPLRWVSYGPFWRNESLRLGRGREFRQWNIDVVGAPAAARDEPSGGRDPVRFVARRSRMPATRDSLPSPTPRQVSALSEVWQMPSRTWQEAVLGTCPPSRVISGLSTITKGGIRAEKRTLLQLDPVSNLVQTSD